MSVFLSGDGTRSAPSPSRPDESSTRILVVDDDAPTRRVLAANFAYEGFLVTKAADGASAIAAAGSERPDLVVLDLQMPGLDGGETCRRLKEMPGMEHVPVVLLTAITDAAAHVRCLELGADDFVTKPVPREILLARVRHHLRFKRLRDQLLASEVAYVRQAQRLEATIRMRDELVQMIVHDLKGPLSSLGVGVELLQGLQPHQETDAGQTTLNNMASCTSRLRSMVQNILDVARMEEVGVKVERRRFSLADLALAALAMHTTVARAQGIAIHVDFPPDLPPANADMDLVARVLENLLSNALRLTVEDGDIRVGARGDGRGGLVVTVADRGPGVPAHLGEAIFEKFTSGQSWGANHGLGLTFCRMALAAHGGRIWVEPRPGGGSLFRFHLPAPASA